MMLDKLLTGYKSNCHNFKINNLTKEQKENRLRILEVSFQKSYSHLGSCLSSVDLIDAVYQTKKTGEKFILSNGHAGIALYVILEKKGIIQNQDISELPIHPVRNTKLGIDVSTGSLGQGLTVAVGLALADKTKNVYCLISDGEMAEGSVWESLRIAREQKLDNLKIIVSANGWSGYQTVNSEVLKKRIAGFGYTLDEIDGHNLKRITQTLKLIHHDQPLLIFAQTCANQFDFLAGQDEHYHILTEDEYNRAKECLK